MYERNVICRERVMPMTLLKAFGLAAIAGGLSVCGVCQAHEVKIKGLVLHHPWVHAAVAGDVGTDGFVMITNTGKTPERLIGATLEGAGDAALVRSSSAVDASALCRLENGIEIAPGATLVLKPGASGLLFGAVAKPLREDIYANGTLVFAHAGAVKVEFYVQADDSKAASHSATGAMAACVVPATQ